MSDAGSRPTAPLHASEVSRWDRTHDVVVVGHGAAGGAAAIEACRAGADVVVLERMSRGGGATALSTGLVYFGGGTEIQKACGFEDSVEAMQAYVEKAAGAQADPERVRLYCENSVEHFEWFRALGVEYSARFHDHKVTHPLTDESLVYTGNELAWPHAEPSPAPRGHKPAREGEAGGALMEAILRGTEEAGASVVNDCWVERLVVDEAGRVVGVYGRVFGEPLAVRARRGVLLAAGGFIANKEMLARHAPDLLHCNYEVGTAADDGRGIRMGMGVGAEAVNMSEGLFINSYYPPESHLAGILVDGNGQRFVNEDAYVGRTSDAMMRKADGVAFLIVDDEIYGQTQALHKLAAVEETIEDLERALEMPEGALVHTVSLYNDLAARGEDPYFHKAPKWLRPLSASPFAAVDCRVGRCILGGMTLGGLAAKATGEALDGDGEPIPGLYVAGRNAVGLCREGRTYASGLSIGDATYFGRLAGRQMAAAQPWEETG
jgi:3-oxo-5alpha-steroid 4-dehydrogenase